MKELKIGSGELGEVLGKLVNPNIYFPDSNNEDFHLFAKKLGKRLAFKKLGVARKSLTPKEFVENLKIVLTDRDYLEKINLPFELYLFCFVPVLCRKIFPEEFTSEVIKRFEEAMVPKKRDF